MARTVHGKDSTQQGQYKAKYKVRAVHDKDSTRLGQYRARADS